MIELRRSEPHQKSLGEIAAFLGIRVDEASSSTLITGMTSNSLSVKEGDIFLAFPGAKTHGSAPEAFDPNIHEALLHETSSEVRETTVSKILQPGYKYKERILRPARVVVTDPE